MSNLSILIVEDEAIVAEDLASKVRQLGYEVAGTTATGEEAVELARRHRPALVLMDIRLAGAMDGIAAAQVIHRECNLPVLFLTAHSDTGTVERANEGGSSRVHPETVRRARSSHPDRDGVLQTRCGTATAREQGAIDGDQSDTASRLDLHDGRRARLSV